LDSDPLKVVLGPNHSAIITSIKYFKFILKIENGSLYTFGSDKSGCLGLNEGSYDKNDPN
jgi:hypothetical protein